MVGQREDDTAQHFSHFYKHWGIPWHENDLSLAHKCIKENDDSLCWQTLKKTNDQKTKMSCLHKKNIENSKGNHRENEQERRERERRARERRPRESLLERERERVSSWAPAFSVFWKKNRIPRSLSLTLFSFLMVLCSWFFTLNRVMNWDFFFFTQKKQNTHTQNKKKPQC